MLRDPSDSLLQRTNDSAVPQVVTPVSEQPVDSNQLRNNNEQYSRLSSAGEDAYQQPSTTRKELWSYYLYYNGNNGVGPLSYSQTLFQSMLSAAGYDPDNVNAGAGSCTAISACVVPWRNGSRSVASIVLIANGLCFAIMTILFVSLGSSADYGTLGRWLLLTLTVICWVFEYLFLAIKDASQWPAAFALYCVSYISYGATLVFYAAVFPRLAMYMPEVRKAREEDLPNGRISQKEYNKLESLEKNHISNISTAHSNIGYLMTLAINLSVLLPLRGHGYANNLALCLTTTYWVALGIWWFIFQQNRPGPMLSKGSYYFTIGWKQVWLACKEIRHLPQTFTYLSASFLLADGLNTTGTLISIIQNQVVSFSLLDITYYGLAQAVCSIFSTFGFWYIQRYFEIRTKTMFMVTNVFTILIPWYGMIGIWTDAVGYHHLRDFWIYNIVFGLFQAPYYAYSQTMMSEVTPQGYENMFFGLFGITNRASSIIGPNVVQATINNTNNNWMGFPFLFAICFAASIMIWFVDVEKGRENCRKFVEARKIVRITHEEGVSNADLTSTDTIG